MILGISRNNNRFIIDINGKYKYFSLKNTQFLEESVLKSIDFVKNGIICVVKNENSIDFFDIENEEKIQELNLNFSFEKIVDISNDLSYILLQNLNEIKLIDLKQNNLIKEFQFDDILNVNIKLSSNNKYLVYKESKITNQIKIYNIKNDENITFNDEKYECHSSIDFHLLNDELIVVGSWMSKEYDYGSHNYVRFNLLTQTIVERKNCSIGRRITSYYLSNLINQDLIATIGVLGGMSPERRFMLIKTNGEFINHYNIYNLTKFVSSIDGKYLFMLKENSDFESTYLFLLDLENEIKEENIIDLSHIFKM